MTFQILNVQMMRLTCFARSSPFELTACCYLINLSFLSPDPGFLILLDCCWLSKNSTWCYLLPTRASSEILGTHSLYMVMYCFSYSQLIMSGLCCNLNRRRAQNEYTSLKIIWSCQQRRSCNCSSLHSCSYFTLVYINGWMVAKKRDLFYLISFTWVVVLINLQFHSCLGNFLWILK